MTSDTEPPSSPHYPECYRPLDPGFIRVFELEAGNPRDPVVGRLVPQTIDGEPYEAVSYVWGDPRNRHDLIIDDTILSVTANLHGALTAFRHRPLPADSGGAVRRPVRRIWADALCINQENVPERTAQVELMGPIFTSARRVLAWLGWEEGEEGRRHTLDAIRFIHSFMEDPEAGLRAARILLLHHDVSVTGPASRLAMLSEEDRVLFEEQARYWEAVKLFFDIKYFHRAWIVQEVGLTQEAILYSALKPPDEPRNWDPGDEDHSLELDFVDWPLVGRFTQFLDYRAASLVTHLDLKSWVAHHILMVWETNDDGTPKCDFLTAMHWVRILGVTDARDRVYSMLGHPKAVMDGHLVIKPDYTVTRGLVYTQLAANFIRKTQNLYAVSLVDHEEDPFEGARNWDPRDEGRMPSWVPDWHSINRTTPMDWLESDMDAGDVEIQISEGMVGMEGTQMPHLLVKGWVVDEISAVSRRMETTDFPVTNLTRERAKVNPFWLDRVWDLVFPAESSPNRDALAVLESLSLALPLGTREKDQPASPVGPHQTLAEHRKSFAAYVLQYHELRQSVAEDETDTSGYLPARSLYDSLPAEAQAELWRRAEGTTSGGFLECMTWPSMCRVVYWTALGFVGMGSRITRPGDLVCRVPGSTVLMTLRKIPGSSVEAGTIPCVFIAPTVVPACMKRNSVVGGQDESDAKAVRFQIV
ncbi:heterokaryon incompatibility protein-domain-containing protein [Cercophora newfieldiana]|uniref:Heterokaryon incompatibility protein-domain-containing protein n=1 Tax=Cercophora newfieldiana TaxID=92897 RepID=A0AA40CIY2_9PEZI|nr:heterokaryon incompatibility protein-domain-containing protein [Cercophora newfieldiana]